MNLVKSEMEEEAKRMLEEIDEVRKKVHIRADIVKRVEGVMKYTKLKGTGVITDKKVEKFTDTFGEFIPQKGGNVVKITIRLKDLYSGISDERTLYFNKENKEMLGFEYPEKVLPLNKLEDVINALIEDFKGKVKTELRKRIERKYGMSVSDARSRLGFPE